MSRAPDDLEAFRAAFWVGMRRAAADPKAPSRFCALATVAEDGGAEARTVVLRAADPAAAAVEAFTDARTPKLREIAAEPRVTLLYWDPRARLQGRVRGRARAETGPAAAAR
ncbi:MAG: pyridoxamine 5'-phosphate oxidase family protein, partial [Pseudomonadota bacterium]